MKIQLLNLSLNCRKAVINIPFAKGITYFYGKMGAGKSTILQLIDFCLGNELIETPALQQEFNGAELEVMINNFRQVLFHRDKGSNQVNVTWIDSDSEESWNILVPISQKKDALPLFPNSLVYNLSDLIFYLCGIQPPKVRKSKLREDTELIRLSFRDIMWYCYLSQDEIDSSFFYLGREEHDYKRYKSRDIMRLVLGFHQENVAFLEGELYETRRNKSSKNEAANQINIFLKESNIGEKAEMLAELEQLNIELEQKKLNLLEIKSIVTKNNVHLIDEYKNKAITLSRSLHELSSTILDVEEQIRTRKRLQNEYNITSMKVNRSSIARNSLKGVSFCTCPECGQELDREIPTSHCKLCTQEVNEEKKYEETELLQIDLKTRQLELQESLIRLERQKSAMEIEQRRTSKEKSRIDQDLVELENEYDSAFLALARKLERAVGAIEEKIQSVAKLLPLPAKVEQLYKEVDELNVEEERLKRELKEARAKAEKDATNLEELKEFFLDNLQQVGFPGIHQDDLIEINTTDFIPHVARIGYDDLFVMNFSNLSSGGKKTIFKCCFALAVHRLAAKKEIEIPSFLMLDTPMKNISERENKEIFEGFYHFIYKLFATELKDRQLVIVDKEYFDPEQTKNKEYFIDDENFIVRHMTPDEDEYPPLIHYYRGL
ncbi:AAA family ATPase [Paenibacillus sp. RC21]|uniref:AAA family ATPase n=1 Tax=Paenibacillus sp. RC21 TaxID=3156312 RepID=UPI0038324257